MRSRLLKILICLIMIISYIPITAISVAVSYTHLVSLEDLFSQIKQGEMKDLNIIVKADVQGSAEAVKASLEKLSNEEVRVPVSYTHLRE